MNQRTLKPTWLLLSFAALAVFSGAGHAGNGNGIDRGGGDVYVAEFREFQRTILENIKAWCKSGVLRLDEQQQTKLREVSAKVLVLSEDHVYLNEAADGVAPSDEVDAVNIPSASPPKIILGRVRWDAMKDRPLDKELLVLHELLSVSLIHDRAFEESYSLKATTLYQWQVFQNQHRQYLGRLDLLGQKMLSTDFLTQMNTFIQTAMGTRDFQECRNASGSGRRAKKLQRRYCVPLVSLLLQSNEKFLKGNMQKHYDETRAAMNQVLAEYGHWVKSQRPEWANWAIQMTNEYVAAFNQQLQFFAKSIAADKVESILDRRCPSKNDFSFTMTCAYDVMLKDFPAEFQTAVGAYNAAMKEVFDRLSSRLSAQADPI